MSRRGHWPLALGITIPNILVQFRSLEDLIYAPHFGDHISFWDTACTNKRVGLVVEHAGLQSVVRMAPSPTTVISQLVEKTGKLPWRSRPVLSQFHIVDVDALPPENPQQSMIESPGMVKAESHCFQPPEGIVSSLQTRRELRVYLTDSSSSSETGQGSVITHTSQHCSFQTVDMRSAPKDSHHALACLIGIDGLIDGQGPRQV